MERTIETVSAEICVLMNRLNSQASDIGDWKIIKIYEARLQNLDDPYDASALMAERASVRESINALQDELATLIAKEFETAEE